MSDRFQIWVIGSEFYLILANSSRKILATRSHSRLHSLPFSPSLSLDILFPSVRIVKTATCGISSLANLLKIPPPKDGQRLKRSSKCLRAYLIQSLRREISLLLRPGVSEPWMGRPSMTDQKLVLFPTGTKMRDLFIKGAGQLQMYVHGL